MVGDLREVPRTAWADIVRWTAIIVIASTVMSVVAAQAILEGFGDGLSGPGLAASIVLPALIGCPMSFWHLVRVAQLRIANQKLQVLASTDWLTTCLNRRAFTNLVSKHLEEVGTGAFLVIDADHFKVINDRYGHDRGDEVLQVIAATIKASVRGGDLVGRIGGEEFGVFLAGASIGTTMLVAERIRRAISAPDGRPFPLSVSVGGAFFDGRISFADLFRIADQRLYAVKQSGRNRVDVARAGELPIEEQATANEAA